MFYRILNAPPGYGPDENFMAGKFRTLEYDNCGSVTKSDGSKFFATVDEAREALPVGANQLPFERDAQFLELWEAIESDP